MKNSDGNDAKAIQLMHQTIKIVTNNLNDMKFNTALSRLMECVNHFSNDTCIEHNMKLIFIKLISPFVPHLAEELWELNGGTSSVFLEDYPIYSAKHIEEDNIAIAIQVNGKLRGSINIQKDVDRDYILKTAKLHDNVKNYLIDKKILKEILVPGRLVNFVIK